MVVDVVVEKRLHMSETNSNLEAGLCAVPRAWVHGHTVVQFHTDHIGEAHNQSRTQDVAWLEVHEFKGSIHLT